MSPTQEQNPKSVLKSKPGEFQPTRDDEDEEDDDESLHYSQTRVDAHPCCASKPRETLAWLHFHLHICVTEPEHATNLHVQGVSSCVRVICEPLN